MTIALVSGAWSSNIGNAFYNLGAEWLLKDIGLETSFFPESPRWKGDVQSHFDAVGRLQCDFIILNGPCLHERLPYVYHDTFKMLYSRGIKVGYLSAGMGRYDEEEVKSVTRFFEEFPPLFVCTRDHQTADLLDKSLGYPIYDGIDTSMFLNDAVNPLPLVEEPYVVLNFDENDEPELLFGEGQAALIGKKSIRRLPQTLLGRKVIRTSNLSIDEGYSKIYRKPNTYHSDLPQGYCSILKYADVVYSERVHTCAAALIYGTRVQFVPRSKRSFEKRSQVFQRIGVLDIQDRPVNIDFDVLNEEKNNMRNFLQGVLK